MLARLISGAPNSSNALEAARELVASVKIKLEVQPQAFSVYLVYYR